MFKKLISLSFFLAIFCYAHAQSNLQFSQVFFFSQDTTLNVLANTNRILVKDIVVPQGKALKIESASSSGGNTGYPYLYLNNSILYSGTGQSPPFPVWLPSGSYQLSIPFACNGTSCDITYSWWVSAIEFNIVP